MIMVWMLLCCWSILAAQEPIGDVDTHPHKAVYRYLCEDSTVTLTADSAMTYHWSTDETTRSITVSSAGWYTVTTTSSNSRLLVDTFMVVSVKVNAISEISVPEMCAGNAYPIAVGRQAISNISFVTHETVLALHDTVFLPDGVECGNPLSCSYRSSLTFAGYEDTAHVNSVNDIRYVRLNLEHSWPADLYINLTCPSNQKAVIMKMGNEGFTFVNSSCIDSIPVSSRGWTHGDNAEEWTFMGLADDSWSTDAAFACDASHPRNTPGIGWNYCWSNNLSEGYTYASGDGLIYRDNNVIETYNPFMDFEWYTFDSSDVANGTQFYHPDESFESLVGCPLNGSWYIEVMDGSRVDNGYIFGWELALVPDIMTIEYVDVIRTTVDGPWVTTVSDSSFIITPPVDLQRDTIINYTFHCYSTYGCGYDTVVPISFFAKRFITEDTIVCDGSYDWHGRTYTQSGVYYDTLAPTVHGCDSIAVLNLTLSPSQSVSVSGPFILCFGDSIVLSVDSAAAYLWSNGETTKSIIVSDSGYYTVRVTNDLGCSSDTSFYISFVYPYVETIDTLVCDSLIWEDAVYKESGQYVLPSLSIDGCDSTTILNVVVFRNLIVTSHLSDMVIGDTQEVVISVLDEDLYAIAQEDLIGPWCNRLSDSSFVIVIPDDLSKDTVFSYKFILISENNGCVYDTTMDIHVYANQYTDLYDTIDVSELASYSWNDTFFTGPGSKRIIRQTIHGADSVIIMHLSVIYSRDTAVCEDELPMQWENLWFEQAGVQSVFYPVDGADSIVVFTLYKKLITYDTVVATVFQNNLPYQLNGRSYDTTGVYSQTLTNVADCDSLLTLVLTVLENVENEVDSSICEKAIPFTWNGAVFSGNGTQTVTLRAENGADSVLTMTVHILPQPEAHISGIPVICNGDPAFLTADSAFSYQWSNEATTQSVSILATGLYTLTVTNEFGCFDTASVQVMATVMHPIDSIILPTMCAGNVYTFSIGHQNSANIIIGNMETTLSMTDTVFLPDGVSCQPYGCSYQSPLTFTSYPDDAVVNDVNDILYVRLNMEHSYAADLYIKLTCPDGQKADILRFKGHEGSQFNGDCMSAIPYASRGWRNGNNAAGGTFFGMAYDYHSSSLYCDPNVLSNAPGKGWNYCWSNNTSEGYSYAPGAGSLVYRSVNANSYNNFYYDGPWGSEPANVTIFDSSDVAAGTNFYHPDESFSNLIGCHLNGSWKIEVIDGLTYDNGYIFGWELALAPEITMVENTDVSRVDVEGPWMERVNDTAFWMLPPVTLERDTTVQYLFRLFDIYGCSYDTMLSVTFHARDTVEVDTTVCDRFVWNNITYEESGQISQGFQNVHGCDSTVIVNLTVVPSPQPSISGPSLLCADSTGILSVDSCTSYLWSTGDTTRAISISGPGSYSVTVTESHGCSSSAMHHVSSPANAIVSVSMPSICADSSYSVTMGVSTTNTVVLNQNPDLFTLDVQGSWLYNDEEGSVTVIPPTGLTQDTTLVYAFMLTDTNGCRFDTTVTMTVYPLIHRTIDTVVCDSFTYNDSTYTESGSFIHYFNTYHHCDSIITLNLTIHYSSDTTYDTLNLVENDLPYYFEPADISFVTPEDITFQYTLENKQGCDSVIWQQVYIYSNVPRELDTTVCSLPLEWHGHTFTAAGSITDTLKTSHNSDSLITYTVTVDEMSAAIGDIVQIVCFGASTGAAVATITGGRNPLNYEWKDNGDNAVSTTTQLNDATAGLYTFTVTDLLGCLASDTLTLRNLHDELNPGTITGDQSVCLGSTLEDFTGGVASGGDNGVYQWQLSLDGGDWTVAPGIANQQNYTYPDEPSVSTFRLRRAWVSASCGVAFSDTVEVEVWPGYIDTISAVVCQGEAYMENGFEVDETMTSNPGAFTFERILSTGHCDSVIVLQLIVNQNYESVFEEVVCEGEDYLDHGFVIPASETVDAETLQRTLTLTTAQGCDSVLQLHLTVVDTALQIISLTPDFCEELSAVLVVETELSDYEWNTGDRMPQITVNMPGTYSVTASQGSCRATARYIIEPCEFQLFLPNAITPSKGDGLNDFFNIPEITQRSIYDFEISIFNRWGEMVFYSTDKSFRWNGEVNGKIYPNNVYTYIIRCTNAIGKPHTFTGSVTVL